MVTYHTGATCGKGKIAVAYDENRDEEGNLTYTQILGATDLNDGSVSVTFTPELSGLYYFLGEHVPAGRGCNKVTDETAELLVASGDELSGAGTCDGGSRGATYTFRSDADASAVLELTVSNTVGGAPKVDVPAGFSAVVSQNGKSSNYGVTVTGEASRCAAYSISLSWNTDKNGQGAGSATLSLGGQVLTLGGLSCN